MKIKECKIKGACLLQHDIFHDNRGFFYESWSEKEFERIGIKEKFVQDNRSRSYKNVLRGLHFQVGANAQGKLVSVTHGCVWDVFVDLRKDSETYGQWEGYYLSAEEANKLFIPAGCAHGFLVLSDTAEFSYKCTKYYDPASERSLAWDSPFANITWPLQENAQPILSEKDKNAEKNPHNSF
jgi:dTDP-4-dehydrorhamnose 3,5-epimerase